MSRFALPRVRRSPRERLSSRRVMAGEGGFELQEGRNEARAHRKRGRARRVSRGAGRRADVGHHQTTTAPTATGSITIAPEKRTVIKQRFTGAPVTTVKEKVTVGATVPADVELMAVPDTVVTEIPTVKSYRYFRYNDDVVLVDPSSRRVVQIID